LQNKTGLVNPEDVYAEIIKSDDQNNPFYDDFLSKGTFYYYSRLAILYAFNDQKNYNEVLELIGDDKFDSKGKFKELYDKEVRNHLMRGATYDYETEAIYGSDIHNVRSATDPITRKLLKLISDDMRKKGATNIKDYIQKKQTIGKNNLDDYKKIFITEMWGELERRLMSEIHYVFENYWVEINGEYFNKAYESEEFVNYYMAVIIESRKLLIDLLNDNDTFKYTYRLNHEYFLNKLDLDTLNP
jgi:hypothetical protein